MKGKSISLAIFAILASILMLASCEYKSVPFEHGKKIYRLQSINDRSIIIRYLDSNYRIGDTLKTYPNRLNIIVK